MSDVREVSVDVDEMVITEVVLDEVLISEVALDDEVVESEQVLEVSEKEYEIVEELDEDSIFDEVHEESRFERISTSRTRGYILSFGSLKKLGGGVGCRSMVVVTKVSKDQSQQSSKTPKAILMTFLHYYSMKSVRSFYAKDLSLSLISLGLPRP